MSEPENFIARWSRRKREAEDADATKSAVVPVAPFIAMPACTDRPTPGVATAYM